MIYNTKNDKKYIGSSVNLYERLHKHLSLLRNSKHENQHLQNSFTKNGENSFQIIILEFCNEDELYEKESLYYTLLKPEYNKKDVERHSVSKESIEKIKSSLKEGYKTGRIVSKSKKTICIYDIKGNFIKEVSSINEACLFVKCTPSSINRVAKKQYKQINGYQTFYKGDETPEDLSKRFAFRKFIFVRKDSETKLCKNYIEVSEFTNIKPWIIQRRMKQKDEIFINGYTIKIAEFKEGELLENPNKDNQQPSQLGTIERFND
jgi:hypothetical protein